MSSRYTNILSTARCCGEVVSSVLYLLPLPCASFRVETRILGCRDVSYGTGITRPGAYLRAGAEDIRVSPPAALVPRCRFGGFRSPGATA